MVVSSASSFQLSLEHGQQEWVAISCTLDSSQKEINLPRSPTSVPSQINYFESPLTHISLH